MKLLMISLLCLPIISFGLSIPYPKLGNDIIGQLHRVTLTKRSDIDKLSRQYEVGYFEFLEANPDVNINRLHSSETLVVPSEYILPNVKRRGIVINLSELRLYYFLPQKHIIMTFPVGIGKPDDETPVVRTKIIKKEKNPYWKPTLKTRNQFLLDTGMELPELIDPGKGNPLGNYMMRLGNWVYLIHGTNNPNGVGKRSSGGCIRMFPESIASLFPLVPVGTPVTIVKEPIKVGWRDDKLYLESHVPVDDKNYRGREDLSSLVKFIRPILRRRRAEINWDKALRIANQQTGVPTVIGKAI